MDKKIAIAVVIGIAVVFLFSGGQTIIGNMLGTNATNQQTNQNQAQLATTTMTNNNNIITTADGLQMEDTTVGTGTTAVVGKTVTVNYIGKLTDGTVFDTSLQPGRTPFTFALGAGQVIKGWDEGVAGMKVGGTRILVIPASLGYGAQAVGPIPANSTLVFQVQLLGVK
ncbi:MAG: FKBP-type peptidyl-prolyl cis-trans isomerase [Patescibacteria group bacterium]|nr:FKBP-type peptidyl-prolyl cis-trans isomerase [Patescibacteria group bacterium]MDE1945859.1 FKBP-type peptidyl-prolyl cis-trans isomerase [Patescibacteria group bacterium]